MKDIISKRRKELGLTQQELADKLFVSDKVISKWETGKSVPDTSILVELSKVLEISLDELLNSGVESDSKNIKIAIADKLDLKYKNLLLITSLILVIGAVLFSIGKVLNCNDYYRKYQVIVIVFYSIAILLGVFSIFFFLINRNKLKIDYPRFKDIDDKYIRKLIVIYGVITFIITWVIALTHSLVYFEVLAVLVIAGIIEAIFYLLIYFIYKKN